MSRTVEMVPVWAPVVPYLRFGGTGVGARRVQSYLLRCLEHKGLDDWMRCTGGVRRSLCYPSDPGPVRDRVHMLLGA